MEVELPSIRSHSKLDFSAETQAASRIESAFQPPEHLRRPEVVVSHGEESNALRELNLGFHFVSIIFLDYTQKAEMIPEYCPKR